MPSIKRNKEAELIGRIDIAVTTYAKGKKHEPAAREHLSALYLAAEKAPARARAAVVTALTPHLDHPDLDFGAGIAEVAGVLVEDGTHSGAFGEALNLKLNDILTVASRYPDAKRNGAARAAFNALDTWLRGVVATWSGDRKSFQMAQSDKRLVETINELSSDSKACYWLSRLLEIPLDAPFIVLIPELNEAWELVVDGCADNSQFLTLLSAALAKSLKRLNVDAPASDAMLALARGEGASHIGDYYGAAFALYPWQAIDKKTGVPEDGVHMWEAPGGCGDTCLPSDYPPMRVTPLKTHRVVALVTSPRELLIGGSRLFPRLPASIKNVRKLSAAETKTWNDVVKRNLGRA